jgi:hypothetical protein
MYVRTYRLALSVVLATLALRHYYNFRNMDINELAIDDGAACDAGQQVPDADGRTARSRRALLALDVVLADPTLEQERGNAGCGDED